jgi:O-antigen/teichoic acid export membrane protein
MVYKRTTVCLTLEMRRFGKPKAQTFSALIGVSQRFLQILVSLLLTPALMSALGQSGFGLWAAAASLTWISGAFDLGIGNALVTDFSRAMAMNDRQLVKRLLATAMWMGVSIAILESSLAFWLIPRFAPVGSSDAYLIAAFCMALNVPAGLATPLWTAQQRLDVVWIWEAFQTVLTTTVMFIVISVTQDVRIYVAVSAGGVLASSCASLAHLLIRNPDLSPIGLVPMLNECRQLFLRSFPYFLLACGAILVSSADSIISLSMLGADQTAVMAICQRIGMTAVGLLFVCTQPLWPAFANAAVRGEIFWIKNRLWTGIFMITAVAVVGSGLLILFGERMIDVWLGGKLIVGDEILWAMAIWITFPALGRLPVVLLNALGVVWFQVKVAIIFGFLAFALKLGLGNLYGVKGILAASGLAYGLTHLPAYAWWLRDWMRGSADNVG